MSEAKNKRNSRSNSKTKSTSRKKPVRDTRDKPVSEDKGSKAPSKLRNEITALIVIACGIFLLISFHSEAVGRVGVFFESILKGCFASSAFILPYYLLGYGILLLIGKIQNVGKKSVIFLSLVFLALIMMNSIRFYDELAEYSLSMDMVKAMYNHGIALDGGGIVGGLLCVIFINWFGEPGTYIFAITILIISVILLTGTPISTFITSLKEKNKLITETAAEKMVIKDDLQEEQIHGREQQKQESGDYNQKQIKIIDYMKDEQLFNKKEVSIKSIAEQEGQAESVNSVKEAKEKKKNVDLPKPEVENIKINLAPDPDENYQLPKLDLLNKLKSKRHNTYDRDNLVAKAEKLEETLHNFGVKAKVLEVSKGPTVTRYEIQPSPGVKVSSIVRLSDDIALNLEASSIRMEAPIPGKAAVGIEIQNEANTPVTLREVLESSTFKKHPSKITFAVGKDISGNPMVTDLGKMPHLLIAGATGSGKSVCINSIIISILYKARPEEVKLLLIDPKVVELNVFNGIPHLLIPVVTDPGKAAAALNWAVQEMTNRYKAFAEESVRDLESYNKKMARAGKDSMPQVVIVIDELADLMMASPAQVEEAICRLAQMARAAGMHLIVATQRPSVDVITGVIKANVPSRIAFAVSSMVDSRTILDMGGAEKLLGRGDMLFYPSGMSKPTRIQGSLIMDHEVERVIQFVKDQTNTNNYSEEIIDTIESGKVDMSSNEADSLLKEAIDLVVSAEQASVSMLQRRFRIGYNRAARLMDEMEERGIVGAHEGSKPRRVLLTKEELEELSNETE